MRDKVATKSNIVICFFKLMQTKSYDKITVKEICKKTNTSRMTFYRNFHTKEDLVRYHFDIMYTSFLQQLLTNPTHQMYDILNIFFQLIRDDKDSLDAIVKNNLTDLMRERLRYFVQQLIEEGVVPVRHHSTNLLAAMFAGGISDLLIEWSREGMKEDVDSVVLFISKYMRFK